MPTRPTTKRPLLIGCPESVITAFDIPEKYLSGEVGARSLKLMIDVDDYDEVADEGSRLQNTSAGVRMSAKNVRYGFKVIVKDEKFFLRQAVKRLAEIAISTGFTDTPVPLTVVDYLNPQGEDLEDGRDYTTRYGFIYLPLENVKGLLTSSDAQKYSGAFGFTFKETAKRLS